MNRPLNEPELPDNYPIYGGYWYLVDGKPYLSDWHGITANELKKRLKAKEIKRCDAIGRKLI